MDIVLLCKVVDNFGDIGVVYRLSRSLSELPEPPTLHLVVDDLEAFRALDPEVDASADFQLLHGWKIYRWGGAKAAAEKASAAFRAHPPEVILECFACGRPDWLEALLFEQLLFEQPELSERGCLLVDLEFLTAEAYAEEFHKMPSLTRSSRVRKVMFLPGFTPKTGGLILDKSFMSARSRAASREGRVELRRELLSGLRRGLSRGPAAATGARALPPDAAGRFWACVFTYERDYAPIVADLAAFAEGRWETAEGPRETTESPRGMTEGPRETTESLRKTAEGPRETTGSRRVAVDECHFAAPRPLLAISAAGKSQACFHAAWEAAGRPFPLLELPFLPQENWDRFLLASDFSIVRGEDSWSRAALSGRPFLWQAYPQAERYQMVKVEAFLEALRPRFGPLSFAELARSYRDLNDRDADGPETRGRESILPLLKALSELEAGFGAFSAALASGPGLAANLMTFLREIV